MDFIELGRQFRELSDKELDDPDSLAAEADWKYRTPFGWGELLRYRRVLLIAEAGSGKTAEMKAQALRLRSEGKNAFFLPLEALDKDKIADLLDDQQEQIFQTWLIRENQPAWFFLDAVDELKLVERKLDHALLAFAKQIAGRMADIHVILSCRPNDWRPDFDMTTYRSRLPVPHAEKKQHDPEAIWLSGLSRRENNKEEKSNPEIDDSVVKTVILLPLSDQQIGRFAHRLGINDTQAFLSEIARVEAWSFARRPLDLGELANTWMKLGRLGTRQDQHAENIRVKLNDDPDRPDAGALDDAEAQIGAERLALALALSRSRTIRAPEQSLTVRNSAGVLDAREILPNWTEQKRNTLLRRALFDPATYGRVRFHHRSVQEFLAAKHLWRLRQSGMSVKAIHRLLFGKLYGQQLVLPSMRPITAWLALWDETVRRTVIAREPETLLRNGDPESLLINTRADILTAFAEKYGRGGWRGLNIPLDEVQRLASPMLESTIRSLWARYYQHPDVGELLIELIWQGALKSCVDLAEQMALERNVEYHHRVIAVRALISCRALVEARRVADSLVANPANWSVSAVHALVADLFPTILTVDELISLLERVPEQGRAAGGLSWSMKQIIEAVDPCSRLAIELRDRIAVLIWKGRAATQEHYQIRGAYNYLSPFLAALCLRQLMTESRVDTDLARAIVIASRFQPDDTVYSGDIVTELRKAASDLKTDRELIFWMEDEIMYELAPTTDASQRWFHVWNHGLITTFNSDDRDWLLAALADPSRPDKRKMAMQVLLDIWRTDGRPENSKATLLAAVSDDADLTSAVACAFLPIQPNPQIEEMKQKHAQHQAERAENERKRLAGWNAWRDDLLANPDKGFLPENIWNTLLNLYHWLTLRGNSGSHYGIWDEEAIRQAFNDDIADRTRKALATYWRTGNVELWSERDISKRNEILYSWIIGLCALSVESKDHDWAKRLNSAEAELATRYATIEINGFPPFIQDLATAHPNSVKAVIGAELTRQFSEADRSGHLPLLEDVGQASPDIKLLFAQEILKAILTWPPPIEDENARSSHYLDTALRILSEVGTPSQQEAGAAFAADAFTKAPEKELAQVWLRGLFRLDPEKATELLLGELHEGRQSNGITLLKSLFGNFSGVMPNMQDNERRAKALADLVRAAYRIAGPANNSTELIDELNNRDEVGRAREFLLSALVNTSGPVAQREMQALANEPQFSHFPDRLRMLARDRAALDAEFPPYSSAAILALETQYEGPPSDSRGLFDLILDRLDDIQFELSEGDFSDRRTLQQINDEIEMQRTLAMRLKSAANGAYLVSRENEVADRKRTDIHIDTPSGNIRGAIEIKMADSWTVGELEDAIRDQLVGQYLRDPGRKVGVLLITFAGRKRYWLDPETGVQITFEALVERLRRKAESIQKSHHELIYVGVAILDLREAGPQASSPIPETIPDAALPSLGR